MILDKDLLCSEDQTLAINTGSVASTDLIDLAKAGVGRGEPVRVFCQMTDDFACTTPGATIAVKLQTDDNAEFSSATDLFTSATLTSVTAVAGYRPIDTALPSNVERYIRFYYTVATQNATGGTITAGLCLDEQTNKDPVALGLTS